MVADACRSVAWKLQSPEHALSIPWAFSNLILLLGHITSAGLAEF